MKRLLTTSTAAVLALAATSPLAAQTAIGSLAENAGTTIRGEVTDVFGNEFVLADDSGRVLVETGPSWYRSYDFKVGETLTVTGEPDDDNEFDAYTIERPGGETITIRERGQRPPWAGGRDRAERRDVDRKTVDEVVQRFEGDGFTSVRFEESDGPYLEFKAQSADGKAVEFETRRNGRLHKIDIDDGEIALSAFQTVLSADVLEKLRAENLERIEELEIGRRGIEVEGYRTDGSKVDLRLATDERRGERHKERKGERHDERHDGRKGDRDEERQGRAEGLERMIEEAGYRLDEGETANLRAGGTVRAENPFDETVVLRIDGNGDIASERVVR
ncbi:hypothetical protein [Fulvimarina endophytica]|uniref:hypothetical protein n=1 Tax=Fulvimarina endophytica TaxID=2293836 RepID=UPI0018F2EA55|nr:hypothetical protein [Fulvimarina endophytica]